MERRHPKRETGDGEMGNAGCGVVDVDAPVMVLSGSHRLATAMATTHTHPHRARLAKEDRPLDES